AELISLSDALKILRDNPNRVVVTDWETLCARVPAPGEIVRNTIELRVGAREGFDELIRTLSLGGFERSGIVESVGQIAVRGGIIDLFPAGSDHPIRLEFFGDEIESIREFDPGSQRSIRDLERVDVMARLFHAEDDLLASTILDHLPPTTTAFLEEPER